MGIWRIRRAFRIEVLALRGCASGLRAYPRRQRLCKNSGNPTHGSGWIVQVRPTEGGLSPTSPNTTHGSRWIVQVRPTEGGLSPTSPNTTHGSGWIVQVRPTEGRLSRASPNTTHGSGWIVQVQPTRGAYRDSRFSSAPSVAPQGRAMTKRRHGCPLSL